MLMLRRSTRLFVFLVAVSLAACGGSRTKGDGPGSSRIPSLPGDAVPRKEARSRYGNGPDYEVFGKHYTVMADSANYSERGVASWYGKKFHGNLTSNREVYDMYEMTAAHKTLPLPTYVRVRNLRNNKSIVVRVNDRGPFVGNRIIDLSYVAAMKLDMIADGTGLVEVTAINFDLPAGDRPTRMTSAPVAPTPAPKPVLESIPEVLPPTNQIFVQVGAFGDRVNATRRIDLLSNGGIENAFVHADNAEGATMFRVRIGPVAGVIQYDVLVEELENLGISDPYLITE